MSSRCHSGISLPEMIPEEMKDEENETRNARAKVEETL